MSYEKSRQDHIISGKFPTQEKTMKMKNCLGGKYVELTSSADVEEERTSLVKERAQLTTARETTIAYNSDHELF